MFNNSVWRKRFLSLADSKAFKKAAIFIAILIPVGLIRAFIGVEQSILVGILTGLSAYYIADGIVIGAQQSKLKLKTFLCFVENNKASLFQMGLYIGAIVLFFGQYPQAKDPFVVQVQYFIDMIGLPVVLTLPVVFGVAKAWLSKNPGSVVSFYFTKLISGLAGYSIVSFFVGLIGDDAKAWALANPDKFGVTIATFALIGIIIKYSYGVRFAPANINRNSTALMPGPTTPRDDEYTSAHEAGHALTYAALGSLPPNLKLVIKKEGSIDNSLGFISAIQSNHQLDDKAYSEWTMLTLLAGQLGETYLLGNNTLGSGQDHDRWLALARTYLSNHFDGIFYNTPANAFEQDKNESKLEDLKKSQLEILRSYFDKNEQTLKSIRKALFENKNLNARELSSFLKEVSVPDSFPKPLGEFESFGGKWNKSKGFFVRH